MPIGSFGVRHGLNLATFAQLHRVRFVRKDESRLMRLLAALMAVFGYKRFLTHAWTTLGRTIYYPTLVKTRNLGEELKDRYGVTELFRRQIEHELFHVNQWRRWLVLYSLSYLFLPVPVLGAWFRWYWERDAYLHEVYFYPRRRSVDDAVDTLWSVYLWPWPKPLMRRWFKKKLAAMAGGPV